MKKYTPILLLLLVFSCKKDRVDPTIPAGALYQIKSKDMVYQTLEYKNGKISKILDYKACGIVYFSTEYAYSGDRITATQTGTRGMLSSWSGDCDAKEPFHYSSYQIKYDQEGRQISAENDQLRAEYEYANSIVTVRTRYKKENFSRVEYFALDRNGNITERWVEGSADGLRTRYEYDNKTNPFNGLGDRLWPDPFSTPNNVIRAYLSSGDPQWERKFTYDAAGRPLTLEESNGLKREYQYR